MPLSQRVEECFCYLLGQTILRATICSHLEFGGLRRCLAFEEDLACPCLGRDLNGLGIFLGPCEGCISLIPVYFDHDCGLRQFRLDLCSGTGLIEHPFLLGCFLLLLVSLNLLVRPGPTPILCPPTSCAQAQPTTVVSA